MTLAPFTLERYFARHEFSARHLLSSSDCEALSMAELLDRADEVTRALWADLRLGYTESQGHPLVRAEAAQLHAGLSPDDLVLGAPQELVALAMQALVRPGDHIICTFPGYQSLYEIARSLGAQVDFWEAEESEAGWTFSLEGLERVLTPHTRLVIANFPHNPTGALPDPATFDAFLALLEARGIALFSDEMYRLLEREGVPTLPSACTRYDRAVSLFGLSKTYGLPGLRLGWLATRDTALRHRILELKDYASICSSAPSELLALAALRDRDRILADQRARLARNLRALDAFYAAHAERFAPRPTRGGSVTFPRWIGPGSTWDLAERAVQEAGIMIAPSRVFHAGEAHLRIGFGRENLPEILQALAAWLPTL